MFFVPLNQIESVELVVNALRVAAGEADCTTCPAAKVCMKQCLTIAESVQNMLEDGTLPKLNGEPVVPQEEPASSKPEEAPKPELVEAPESSGAEVLQFRRNK